jgi:hypothetical protein
MGQGSRAVIIESLNLGLNNQSITIDVNDSQSFSQLTPSDTSLDHYVLGQNVLVEFVDTNADGDLNLVLKPMAGSKVVMINALQIETVDFGGGGDPDPLPEPGTALLLGIGAIAMTGFARHETKGKSRETV